MGYKPSQKITLPCLSLQFNPAVSTTYYSGSGNYGWITTVGASRYYIPFTGVIRNVELFFYINAVGTNEAFNLLVRKNNATDYTVCALDWSTTPNRSYAENLNIPVSKGDYIEFKITTPNWVGTPTGVRHTGYIVCEVE